MASRVQTLLAAMLLTTIATAAGAQPVYLYDSTITVELGPSMAAEPFADLPAAVALANIIDAPTAASPEDHISGSTHVWVSGGSLELNFDLAAEYDLTTLHIWNYFAEDFDVDNIDFTFLDSNMNPVGTLPGVEPMLGGAGGNPIFAEDIPLSFPSFIRYVNAVLTGTNGQVDFNNIGFTGRASQPDCGDGVIDEPEEECDDGNVEAGDGCNESCRIEPFCGAAPQPGIDCKLIASYFLPSKVAYKPNASDPTKGKLVSAGVFDTGPDAVDLTGAATLEVGGRTVPIASLPPKGAGFLFREGGVTLSLKPAKTGSSRAKFKLVVLGDLTGAVNPNQALPVRFSNVALDAGGEVVLTDGKFKLGRQRGALVAPGVYLAKARAKLADSGSDSFTLTAGLATDGQTPAAASDATVGFGDAFGATVPAAAFARKGERWSGTAAVGDGSVSVVLDYLRETATVKAKGVELGDFAQGPGPLRVELSVGDAARAVTVRAVRKGASLRY